MTSYLGQPDEKRFVFQSLDKIRSWWSFFGSIPDLCELQENWLANHEHLLLFILSKNNARGGGIIWKQPPEVQSKPLIQKQPPWLKWH